MSVFQEGASPMLEIRLLGPMDVRVAGTPLARLRTRKGFQLLGLLALRAPGDASREWLASTLWPDSEPQQGAYNLRRALSDLRSALGPAGELVESPSFHTLRLHTGDRAAVDLALFNHLRGQQTIGALAEAAGLCRGSLLEGWNDEWALSARIEWQQSYQSALGSLAALAEERADWQDAVHWLRRIVQLEPFDERAHHRLMALLEYAGSPAAAMLVYREFRARLRSEMNSEPSLETSALYERLRTTSRTAGVAVAPREVVPAPTREHALPVQLTSFVGRDDERRELVALLDRSRLLTLVGTGGCGKTRLAIEVAGETVGLYPDGIKWVEFASVARPEAVWRVLADAVGAKEQTDRSLEVTVRALLISQRCLLLMDNCEHLVGAIARMTAALLQSCPSLRILATSREPLNVTGETTWRVPSLSAPRFLDAGGTQADRGPLPPQTVLEYESVRLFADRAALADRRFAVDTSNAWDVAQICGRLDGIPLAIELAASRVGTMTAGQIACRLDDRFRLLKWARNDLLPRQQTLRALIDWSYDLLTDLERVLFRRLSVFAGGWSLEAAENVACGGALSPKDLDPLEVQELHSRLVDKSLVAFETDTAGGGRYRMLETIRQFASEKLRDSGEQAAVQDRFTRWCAEFSRTAGEGLNGAEQARILQELDVERDNLEAALEMCIHAELGLRIASSVWRYWYVRGRLREGSAWLERGLEQNPDASPPVRALAELRAGVFAWSLARLDEADTRFRSCLASFRDLGDETGVAWSLNSLGMVAQYRHDYKTAFKAYSESIDLCRRTDKKRDLATTLLNLGAVSHSMGDLEQSLAAHNESLALRRELGDSRGAAFTACALGRIHVEMGDMESALQRFVEGYEVLAELNDTYALSQTMFGMAYYGLSAGNAAGAIRLLGCMEKMREKMGVGAGLEDDPGLVTKLDAARDSMELGAYDLAWSEGRELEPAVVISSVLYGTTG